MGAPAKSTMSQPEYAKHRGVSQPLIAKYIRQGKLEGAVKKVKGRYRIDAAKADAILKKRRLRAPPQKSAKGPQPSSSGNLFEAQVKSAWLKTMLLKLQVDRETRNVIPRQEMERQAARIGGLLRVQLEALPAKLAVSVAGADTPAECARVMQKDIKRILNNISKEIAGLAEL